MHTPPLLNVGDGSRAVVPVGIGGGGRGAETAHFLKFGLSFLFFEGRGFEAGGGGLGEEGEVFVGHGLLVFVGYGDGRDGLFQDSSADRCRLQMIEMSIEMNRDELTDESVESEK